MLLSSGPCGAAASVMHTNPVGEKHYWCETHRRKYWPTREEARRDAIAVVKSHQRSRRFGNAAKYLIVSFLIGILLAALKLSASQIVAAVIAVVLGFLLLKSVRRTADKHEAAIFSQLEMMHRVLLDGLKPESWEKLLTAQSKYDKVNFEEEDWKPAERFIEQIRGVSLRAVSPQLLSLHLGAIEEIAVSRDISHVIDNLQNTGPLEQKRVWERTAEILCRCKEIDAELIHADSRAKEVGQTDMVEWFSAYVAMPLRIRRIELQRKLEGLLFNREVAKDPQE